MNVSIDRRTTPMCHLKAELQQDIFKCDFFKCVEIHQGWCYE
jgi:hypothetical protein